MYNPNALQSLETSLESLRNSGLLTPDFEFRLNHFYQSLYSAYSRVYGENSNAEFHLHKLIELLAKRYSERPEELKETDRQRERNSGWFLNHRLAGMQLYTERFAGNIAGLKSRLDYFQELSVNVLHLMPLQKSPEHKNDGGYAVSDYLQVDERAGTVDGLKDLCRRMHQQGMYLMLDLVVNHTSDEHQWAEKAKKGDPAYLNYYYTFEDRMVPDLFEHALPEIFPENAPGNFTWNEEMGRWVMTIFNSYQWDLNYTNPEVFREITGILLTQANWGVDIFRLDAVAFLWKRMGTDSQNLDKAHEILQLLKVCSQIVAPGVIFLAEAIVAPAEIMKYFGSSEGWSNECDMAYNATLMASLWDAVATGSTRILVNSLHSLPSRPVGTTWVNYIRCHDDIGLGYDNQYSTTSANSPVEHRDYIVKFFTGQIEGSFARGLPFMINPVTGDARISGSLASLSGLEMARADDDEEAAMMARRRITLLLGIIVAWEGMPMIYYGDELATLNDYSFTNDPRLADDSRWVHRPRYDWTQAERRYRQGTDEQYVFDHLKRMLSIRQEYPVFDDNQSLKLVVTGNEHILGFHRQNGKQKFLLVANFSDTEELMDLHFLSALRMERYRMKDLWGKPVFDKTRLIISGCEMHWFFQED